MVTLRQIAELAGVSVQTVANVLQGRNKECWPSVVERARIIREIAARLDYRPNAAAKSMRTHQSRQIGILIRNDSSQQRFRNISAFETLLGINEELERAGYVAALVRVGDVRSSARSRVFHERMLDGMIVLSAIPTDIEQMVEGLIPKCIWVDTNLWRDRGVVRRDERHAGRLAAQALANLGYQQLLWFGRGPKDGISEHHYSFVERLAGVRHVVKRQHLQLATLMASRTKLCREPEQLASFLRPDTGIIAYSTPHARWLAHIANSMGLRCGYDFGLVCCDDSHDLSTQWPSLSRVSFDRFGIGVRAAKMMLNLLKGEACPSTRIRGHWKPGNTAWGPRPFPPLPLPITRLR
jgi:DNA-binding LacI/PurR family transcriptional regulator